MKIPTPADFGDQPKHRTDAAARILKFLRMMHANEAEESIKQAAIDRCWLDETGHPTPDGLQLVSAFDEIERAQST